MAVGTKNEGRAFPALPALFACVRVVCVAFSAWAWVGAGGGSFTKGYQLASINK